MTVGHHGVFSLTPIWILSICGCVGLLKYGDVTLKQLAAMTLLLTTVCFAFYLMRPVMDRNYGGVASGFRWMFWLAPLYLITMIPSVRLLSKSPWGRAALVMLLATSAFSAFWGFYNPWVYPWTYSGWQEQLQSKNCSKRNADSNKQKPSKCNCVNSVC